MQRDLKNTTRGCPRGSKLERFVMHFKAVLPGIIGLTIGTTIGDWALNGFDRTFLRVYMICGGYILGYIMFKVNT